MEVVSSRSTLYRTARQFVIWAGLCLACVQVLPGQASRTPKKYKGPRALGLIELAANGKARLIPVAILIDGEFYDASAYKASPVPMALWAETVYEGFRTGVSEGLFTVSTGLQNPQTHEWFGDGRWLSAGSIAAKSAKKESSIPRGMNDDSGPPVLRHSGSAKPKAPEPAPARTPPATQTAPPSTPTASPGATSGAPSSSPTTTPQEPSPSPQPSASQASSEPEDKDRPTLKRGKPAEKPDEPLPPLATSSKAEPQAASPAASNPKPQVQWIPAISDADGPDAQPYNFVMTPDEEHQLRDKVLALAAEEVRARAKQLASEAIGPEDSARNTTHQKTKPAKPVQPSFEDVQFRAFDLSNSNEPVLVLSARARLPKVSADQPSADLKYMITLVARQDINGDLNKAFSNVTDNQHLDVIPDVQLIDAVDADGDGRGELLFRQVSDAGTAYVIYRVIGNQLYALFQGTPQ